MVEELHGLQATSIMLNERFTRHAQLARITNNMLRFNHMVGNGSQTNAGLHGAASTNSINQSMSREDLSQTGSFDQVEPQNIYQNRSAQRRQVARRSRPYVRQRGRVPDNYQTSQPVDQQMTQEARRETPFIRGRGIGRGGRGIRRGTGRGIGRGTGRATGRWTGRATGRWTGRATGKRTGRATGKWTGRATGKRTGRGGRGTGRANGRWTGKTIGKWTSRGFGRGIRRGTGRWIRRGGLRRQVTKEQLDTELEEYMSHTKSALDAELDQYMAESKNSI